MQCRVVKVLHELACVASAALNEPEELLSVSLPRTPGFHARTSEA